jgi:3-oxoadipate enol-lactonase
VTVSLHYTVDGPADAPVLVLGSSLGTDGRMWAPQVPLLARQFRVVRYDHRGHGRSAVPPGDYQLADLGGDVLALLDHLGVPRAHIGGLSLGGMVSMWLAAHAPERVDRLALVCTSAKLGPPRQWADRAAAVRAGGMGAVADTVLARWTPAGFAGAHPDVVAGLRAMLLATPPDGYAAACAAIGAMDLEPDLGRITAPTLVLTGDADEATPPEHAHRIAALIPDSEVVLVPGAAHLANVARPDLVGQLLADFLSGASLGDNGTMVVEREAVND